MGTFWILIAAALIVTLAFAAYADHKARRAGQVLVPIKKSRFGRTSFVRMDRAELAEQKASAALAVQERERAARKELAGEVQVAKIFGGLFGGTNRRLRR